ncbi:hypothetical protein N0V94_008286 [Neodidymelliopsis sp. IMI 364377]|nr:hypothetical protein N0V94_008286 [Neodidymelliopsis sp. IMI 364377]
MHPIFHSLSGESQLQPMLQLASRFLDTDRTLEFFVPLLFGQELTDLQSNKTYLADPLVHATEMRRTELISEVRQALLCLAHCIEISFAEPKRRLYARTVAKDITLKLTPCCCKAFQNKVSPKIEMAKKFNDYYHDTEGYETASRCARFRHDFLFATTLLHEIVHAVGVMRRGNLKEAYYQLDFPETEWGYAWENFMFGGIINPQDRTRYGTHILMRKVWADPQVAELNGGKEYSDVPMSWIAQWFREETWAIVAERGPTAIKPPTTHFKIQVSHELSAWVVTSKSSRVRKDITALYQHWQKYGRQMDSKNSLPNGRQPSRMIYYDSCTKAQLQIPNVPTPSRTRKQISLQPKLTPLSDLENNTQSSHPDTIHSRTQTEVTIVTVCTSSTEKKRKQRTDSEEQDGQPRKAAKLDSEVWCRF